MYNIGKDSKKANPKKGDTMSLRIKEKELKDQFYVIGVPYCELQYLLRFYTPFGHTEGVYGWKSDCYQVDMSNFVISTGYGPVQNIEIEDAVKREIIKKYNDKAKETMNLNELDALLYFFKQDIIAARKKEN